VGAPASARVSSVIAVAVRISDFDDAATQFLAQGVDAQIGIHAKLVDLAT
jgi:hypothetical protein